MNKNKTMMFLFLASEALFFLALIMAYVYYSHQGSDLSGTARYLDFQRTGLFTIFLLVSSFTMEFAGHNRKKGKSRANLLWLGITILLGLIFLFGQGAEYARLIHVNLTISQNVFGSAFFTLTGFHGLHVILGLIALIILAFTIFSGNFKKVEATVFKSISLYWHFVDVVWIAVFSIVYIGAII